MAQSRSRPPALHRHPLSVSGPTGTEAQEDSQLQPAGCCPPGCPESLGHLVRVATLFSHGSLGSHHRNPSCLILQTRCYLALPGERPPRAAFCEPLTAATAAPTARALSHCPGLFLTSRASGSRAKNTTQKPVGTLLGYFCGSALASGSLRSAGAGRTPTPCSAEVRARPFRLRAWGTCRQ